MIQSCLFCSSFCTKRHLPFSFFWTQWLNHCLRFVYTPAMNPSWTEAFTFLPSFNFQATWRAGDLNSLFSLGIGSVKQAARWFGISKKQRHSTDHICIRAVASCAYKNVSLLHDSEENYFFPKTGPSLVLISVSVCFYSAAAFHSKYPYKILRQTSRKPPVNPTIKNISLQRVLSLCVTSKLAT